ncbi:hypothetical protein HHI36_006647 [Cryptolaemus montrouzieri]|uniref:Large ribosomal subunit protein uL29m n=1 Tax=Cryptolaemus montrouzieri TaxID=559131 RepID=A0ABD2NY78_9CUCU
MAHTRLSQLFRVVSQIPISPKFSICDSKFPNIFSTLKCSISTSTKLCDLSEFFDAKENWGAGEVKSGRSWTKDDLRIKSNEDLHKLWYVLLKERNMLLTMEEEAKEQTKFFPSPERLDKVQDSMKNLEEVVRERNKAYYMLETGKDGERPVEENINPFGFKSTRKLYEFPVPKQMNKKWQENRVQYNENDKDVQDFQIKYREKNTWKKGERRREISIM